MIKSPYDMYVHEEHMHLDLNCLCHVLVDDQVPGTRLRFVEFTQGTITSLLTAAVMLKTHNYAMSIIFSFPSVSRPMYVCTAIYFCYPALNRWLCTVVAERLPSDTCADIHELSPGFEHCVSG